MGIINTLFRKRAVAAADPWVAESIHHFVTAHLHPVTGRFDAQGDVMPDETFEDGTCICQADGALDGVLGHHGASEESTAIAQRLAKLIDRVARRGDQRAATIVYAILKEASVFGLIDPVLVLLGEHRSPFEPHLSEFALRLATQSADRGPVKAGIALLGAMRAKQHEGIVEALGKHEEFTLYAAAALANMFEDAGERLWKLAGTVEGWGRIHVVERLVPTANPRIQQWLRREGFRNSVKYEYLALTAAVHGRLREVLEQRVIDAADLSAAGEIIDAMIAADNNGPAPGMHAYKDAAATCRAYLSHVSGVPGELLHIQASQAILRYVEQDVRAEAERLAGGWSAAACAEIVELARRYVARHDWHALIRQQLASNDARAFARARRAAHGAGIDAYEWHWRRLCGNPRDLTAWFHAMKNVTSERIDSLIELAERSLPLREIATGPTGPAVSGRDLDAHRCLELLLKRLKNFPGKGLNLIAVGLRSPVLRNRNMAINALAAGDLRSWSPQAWAMLELALREETDAEMRARLAVLRDRVVRQSAR